MAIPAHTIHVYQRPKQGSAFLRRYSVYNYQHTITNQGWFDTASCDVAVCSDGEGFNLLEAYLGCYVAIYVDNPAQPIWEGLISRITFNSGKASYSISLDDMANRINVVYTGASNVAAVTTAVDNTTSQAIYGIKQEQIEFGVDPSAGTQRTVLQNTVLAQRALPQTSKSQAGGQTNLVHLELIGIFHTLEWEKTFSNTGTGTTAFNTRLTNFLGTLANGNTFFDNTDLTQISANAATHPNQERGTSVWEMFEKIAESGDGSNYWVTGILPTNRNTGKRVLYYRLFNSNVIYTAYQADGLKPRNPYGQPVAPWLVVPDAVIRVNDILVGHDSTVLTDPRATYIQSVQYDANSQQVQWFGADNTTARAAFCLNRGYKPLSKNMPGSAPTRTVAT